MLTPSPGEVQPLSFLRPRTTSFISVFLVFALMLVWSSDAVAQLKGDRDLLRLVALEWRQNEERILTWEGEVEVTDTTTEIRDKRESSLTSYKTIRFAYDREADKYMFVAKQNKQVRKQAEQAVNEDMQIAWGAIRTSDGFFEIAPWSPDGKHGLVKRPELVVKSAPSKKPGNYSYDFDPFMYLQMRNMNVGRRMMTLYNNADKTQSTVSRDGQRVTLTFDKPEVYNRFVFDLSQGANPVSIVMKGTEVKGEDNRTFTQVSNVWVPETSSSKNTEGNQGRVIKRDARWVKNVVNRKIHPDTFLPEKVGLLQGSFVTDQRTGTEYRYDASSPPEELAVKRRQWSALVITAIVVGGVLTILIVWWLRRRQARRVTNAAP